MEVGPISPQPGFLPSVSVTALRIFNSGGIKRLRASTYGRGIWEFRSDFQASFSNNPLTVFVGQTAVFSGTLTASSGYNASVDLSCAAPSSLVCVVSPNQATPLPSGVPMTVTVTGPVGDYTLNAVGTDANGVAHNFPLTLHIVDFNLTPMVPPSITVNRPNSSVSHRALAFPPQPTRFLSL